MFSQEALETILGIKGKINIKAEEMADNLNITFFPCIESTISSEVSSFSKQLKDALTELKVNIVPYEEALEIIPIRKIVRRFFRATLNNLLFLFSKFFKAQTVRHFLPMGVFKNLINRKKIKRGISVIAIGESETWNLPMDHTTSFTESSVITIVDWPKGIKEESEFIEHFDTAMNLFAYHMTNIIIAVDKSKWLLYNFNASHPVYSRDKDFKKEVLHALIPKIAAPIRPHRFSEFTVLENSFDINDPKHEIAVKDLVEGSKSFQQTKLYPPGKKIADLPFRNDFYKWIGSIHLDERSGMSFGFFAYQLATPVEPLIPIEKFSKDFNFSIPEDKDFFSHDKQLFLIVNLPEGRFCIRVPEIWVLSQRSGSDKTNFVPEKDLVKLGIKNGLMYLQAPRGLKLNKDYKPSFDTKVILAHALGNAIVASVASFYSRDNEFSHHLVKNGMAIAHWHGYFNPAHIPSGFFVHGVLNPHVACSSPQSAIYAIGGKLEVFQMSLKNDKTYKGDIHIEPHHGTNVNFPSLVDLSLLINQNPLSSVLGNKYLKLYN